MKRIDAFVLVIVILACGCIRGTGGMTIDISGRAFDAVTQEPIQGVQLWALNEPAMVRVFSMDSAHRLAESDETGRIFASSQRSWEIRSNFLIRAHPKPNMVLVLRRDGHKDRILDVKLDKLRREGSHGRYRLDLGDVPMEPGENGEVVEMPRSTTYGRILRQNRNSLGPLLPPISPERPSWR